MMDTVLLKGASRSEANAKLKFCSDIARYPHLLRVDGNLIAQIDLIPLALKTHSNSPV